MNQKHKILFILGTRPEAIKLSPLILKFRENIEFDVRVCNTGQHKDLIDEVFQFFQILPDYSLNVMVKGSTLNELTINCLSKINRVLTDFQPDLVIVQGDTTSAFTGALASFYKKIKIAHVEAGLRSGNKFSPFPEETNRVFISKIADYHFTPTELAMQNLVNEGVKKNVWKVGNTVVDALKIADRKIETESLIDSDEFKYIIPDRKIILMTFHRRENYGDSFRDFCRIANELIEKYPDVQIVFPVHPNPNVRRIVNEFLTNDESIRIIDPLPYFKLLFLIKKSYLILSDSGGIQEEAPTFGIPVVVLREVTERTEGITSGNAVLGGNSYKSAWPIITKIMDDSKIHSKMAMANNPYGDGKTSARILKLIETYL